MYVCTHRLCEYKNYDRFSFKRSRKTYDNKTDHIARNIADLGTIINFLISYNFPLHSNTSTILVREQRSCLVLNYSRIQVTRSRFIDMSLFPPQESVRRTMSRMTANTWYSADFFISFSFSLFFMNEFFSDATANRNRIKEEGKQ